jgi:hypothetical protein
LTPTELNPDCTKQGSNDHIVDTQIKGTQQQRIQLYRVIKAGKLLHQGKWLTQGQIQQKFSHLMGNSTKWRPFLPQERGLIQVDIGGYQPIPLSRKTIFHLGSFSGSKLSRLF